MVKFLPVWKWIQRTPVQGATLVLSLQVALVAHAATPEMGDPSQGQSLFATKGCVQCHSVRGAGGRIGPDLGRTTAKRSFFEIASGMWNHSRGMEAKIRELRMVRPNFSGDELKDLIAFVYFLNYFDEPGDPKIGKTLFTEKHCVQCHRLEGQGGRVGPSLETIPRGASPLRIAQGLWNHGAAMVTSMQRRGLDVPQFQGSEIIDLFAYIRSQGERHEVKEFQSSGDPARGHQLFDNKGCSRCHAVFGEESEIGPDLGSTELRGSVTQIAGLMWNHWPAMANAMQALDMPLPIFEEQDLSDLLAYVFVSRYGGSSGDQERGLKVYRDKGCAFCHGLNGEGTEGPPLRQVTPNADAASIAQRMWNHAPEMWSEMGSHQIPWPRFEPQELADLLTFMTLAWADEPDQHQDSHD